MQVNADAPISLHDINTMEKGSTAKASRENHIERGAIEMHVIRIIEDEATRESSAPGSPIHVEEFEIGRDHETDDVVMVLNGHRGDRTAAQKLIFRFDEKCARKLSIELSTAAYRLRLARREA